MTMYFLVRNPDGRITYERKMLNTYHSIILEIDLSFGEEISWRSVITWNQSHAPADKDLELPKQILKQFKERFPHNNFRILIREKQVATKIIEEVIN